MDKAEEYVPTKPYLTLPKLNLPERQITWLRIIYKHFQEKIEITEFAQLPEIWEAPMRDFGPSEISPLLLVSGRDITLYGIYHIEPESPIFLLFNAVTLRIKEVLKSNPGVEAIGPRDVLPFVHGLSQQVLNQIFKLMQSLLGFSSGGYRLADGTYGVDIKLHETIEAYQRYTDLQSYMSSYLSSTPTAWLPTPLHFKSRESFAPVMGVPALASDMVNIIQALPEDKGQMIGIFGKWGRGKTFFLNVLKQLLKESKETEYILVEFHAWKYQETPASWAYLYETMAKVYFGPTHGLRQFATHWWRILRLNVNRFGIWPIVQLVLIITLSIIVPILVNMYLIEDNILASCGIAVGSVLAGGSLIRKSTREYSTKAVNLIKKYGIKSSFKSSMGIQADIEEELVKLFKTWIGLKHVNKKKIVLIVEDIDRCNEEKIIQNIDSLRVMLEDEEISRRLLIVAAIDERVLRNAIHIKYASMQRSKEVWPAPGMNGDDSRLQESLGPRITEYMDKLFICAVKLGALSEDQKSEYLQELMKGDWEPQLVKQPGQPEFLLSLNFRKGEDRKTSPTDGSRTVIAEGSNGHRGFPIFGQNPFIYKKAAWAKLTLLEIAAIAQIVDTWSEATPRRITIFYYRYLLCKNSLIARYALSGMNNVWSDDKSIEAILLLLLHFGNCHRPERITQEIEKLKKGEDKQPDLPGIRKLGGKSSSDHRELLEVLELIVAY